MTKPEPSAAPPPMATVRHRRIDTPLGTYVLAAGDDTLIGVWREAQKHFPVIARLGDPADGDHPILDAAAAQLLEYLNGERTAFDLPMAPVGTPFQHRVWDQLQQIPFGSTTTYGAIARALDSPRAAQAVGAAVGSNPLSIVVPCHRVLASNGALTGYAGGMETKRALLHLEGVRMEQEGAGLP